MISAADDTTSVDSLALAIVPRASVRVDRIRFDDDSRRQHGSRSTASRNLPGTRIKALFEEVRRSLVRPPCRSSEHAHAAYAGAHNWPERSTDHDTITSPSTSRSTSSPMRISNIAAHVPCGAPSRRTLDDDGEPSRTSTSNHSMACSARCARIFLMQLRQLTANRDTPATSATCVSRSMAGPMCGLEDDGVLSLGACPPTRARRRSPDWRGRNPR